MLRVKMLAAVRTLSEQRCLGGAHLLVADVVK